MRNLHHRFVLCSDGQIYGGDFAKFCGLLRIYEFYQGEMETKSKNASNYFIFGSLLVQFGMKRYCFHISYIAKILV